MAVANFTINVANSAAQITNIGLYLLNFRNEVEN
jgi:hypothetical protein